MPPTTHAVQTSVRRAASRNTGSEENGVEILQAVKAANRAEARYIVQRLIHDVENRIADDEEREDQTRRDQQPGRGEARGSGTAHACSIRRGAGRAAGATGQAGCSATRAAGGRRRAFIEVGAASTVVGMRRHGGSVAERLVGFAGSVLQRVRRLRLAEIDRLHRVRYGLRGVFPAAHRRCEAGLRQQRDERLRVRIVGTPDRWLRPSSSAGSLRCS